MGTNNIFRLLCGSICIMLGSRATVVRQIKMYVNCFAIQFRQTETFIRKYLCKMIRTKNHRQKIKGTCPLCVHLK